MQKQITGTMVYYYHVCERKLWYFYHEIQMEWQNEDVAFGKLLDENSYKRDEKHINIDNVINIDFIKAKDILHEVKKSNKIEKASVWQVKYYLYYFQGNEDCNEEKTDNCTDYKCCNDCGNGDICMEDEWYFRQTEQ